MTVHEKYVDIEFSTIKIHELLSKIWKFEVIPEALRKGLIIKLPKNGNLKDCKNSRGIIVHSWKNFRSYCY